MRASTTARAAGSALLALMVAACGGGAATAPSPTATRPGGTHVSAHFVFHHAALDAANIAQIAAAAEAEHARIVADLGVSSMPVVDVTFHADQAALQAAVRPIVGAIPSFAGGLVTSPTQI